MNRSIGVRIQRILVVPYLGVLAVALALSFAALAQAPAKIDFRRDVQPIFEKHCIECHGPTQQMNGLRLDRRRNAMKGGTIPVIGPGNSVASRLYLRLIGNQVGLRMPPTGPLTEQQIAIIKAWIDQGAEWPDDVSGEATETTPDPRANRLMDALRNNRQADFRKLLRENSSAANLKGVGGSTPLMSAALYGDADSVQLLIQAGADVNARNDSGATALMWATDDAEKTRLLLEAKADPNAKSEDTRTPLLIATSRYGASDVVKLLLDAGANPSFLGLHGSTPLGEAAFAGDEATFRLLIERGADPAKAGPVALALSLRTSCKYCFETLLNASSARVITDAAFRSAPPGYDGTQLKPLLEHGAQIQTVNNLSRTLLMAAASSDALPIESVKLLLDRGVDVNVKGPRGATALDFAHMRGHTPVVDMLMKSGAMGADKAAAADLRPNPASNAKEAVMRSLPILQQADVAFLRKTGCISCHNNSLTAMAAVTARKSGIPVNRDIESQQLKEVAQVLDNWRDRVLEGIPIPGDVDTIGYVLLGLAAENYAPDASTDALVRYLKNHQAPDGSWQLYEYRPPLESSEIEVAAAALRSIQLYMPKPHRAEYEKSIQLAANWLKKAHPKYNEDRVFQLLGLYWAGADRQAVQRAGRDLLDYQRPDGGWAQISSLQTDAYATGQALYALRETQALRMTDQAYIKGAQFLRATQLGDGSWYVKTRTMPVQPYFETGFPHGADQFISSAATNWAVLALAPLASELSRSAESLH